jgi:hypothetical protein
LTGGGLRGNRPTISGTAFRSVRASIDPDSDSDLDETMKDMKLHENQEFPLAFQKNPSSAIP